MLQRNSVQPYCPKEEWLNKWDDRSYPHLECWPHKTLRYAGEKYQTVIFRCGGEEGILSLHDRHGPESKRHYVEFIANPVSSGSLDSLSNTRKSIWCTLETDTK